MMEILEYHHNLIRLMRPTNFGMERVQRACLPPKLDAAPSTKKKNFDAQPEAKLPIFQRKKLVIIIYIFNSIKFVFAKNKKCKILGDILPRDL
jgi:hypothetical protein